MCGTGILFRTTLEPPKLGGTGDLIVLLTVTAPLKTHTVVQQSEDHKDDGQDGQLNEQAFHDVSPES